MSDSESDLEFDLQAAAERALAELLPQISKTKYEKTYNGFKNWCTSRKLPHVNEKVLLAYFSSDLDKFKASTCWTYYSMLRLTLNVNENINLADYNNLRAWLNRKGDGYIAKKSAVFKKEDIFKFMKEAPDNQYLAMKVAAAVGLYGAMRRAEMFKMGMNDFKYIDGGVYIRVPETKTKVVCEFVLAAGDKCGANLIDMFKKYVALRPVGAPCDRFFICYREGKCRKQPTGIHTIGSYPRKIATYLNLENVNDYTGHCFRRSSTSFLADTGANITVLKQHGGWKSESVASGYITNSLNNKRNIADKIMASNTSSTVTSNDGASSSSGVVSKMRVDSLSNGTDSNMNIICTETNAIVKTVSTKTSASSGFTFENLTNCTFPIYKP